MGREVWGRAASGAFGSKGEKHLDLTPSITSDGITNREENLLKTQDDEGKGTVQRLRRKIDIHSNWIRKRGG